MSDIKCDQGFLSAIKDKLPNDLEKSHEIIARLTQDLLSVWDAYSTTFGQGDPIGYFSHACMTAGEDATDTLVNLGLGFDQGWGFQLHDQFKGLYY